MTDTPAPVSPPGSSTGAAALPRVAVRGEALLEADPEIARIGVTVQARGSDRRAALEDLTRRNAEVLELVRSYGEAVESTETGSFTLTPELSKHGRGERVRAHHGRVHLQVVLRDFAALGELSTRLAELDLTRVDGPWWSLRPDSPVHRRARQHAVREAVTRAREYAQALGADLVGLIDLADLGTEGAFPSPAPAAPGSALRGLGGAAPEAAVPALDLEPRRQTVHAQVNARFTISAPQL
ncbi:SIMPL domain-containing protein [Streptomyces sp. 549]|uniref:SIMPL domain-containing protein n=1 Tax=Streptomyces sp. 549 TaxID=3049076 RepID=UPI0024C3F309|nr:SIMPL domain-containing protein [Streptomyces sp. 549]MDK1474144.1 SIMPL domain-containing protein [Streptomyces sp. 549]